MHVWLSYLSGDNLFEEFALPAWYCSIPASPVDRLLAAEAVELVSDLLRSCRLFLVACGQVVEGGLVKPSLLPPSSFFPFPS